MELTTLEKQFLLQTARGTIKSTFMDAPLEKADYNLYPGLKINAGAFVTLRKKGQLRGCVGYIQSETPLIDTIRDAALNAAFRDTRFLPLGRNELDSIDIEISVLSPPFKMDNYEDIIIGKHGLILDEPLKRGLLLPQVPIEYNMNRDQFLSALCEKAGFYGDFWKIKKLNILMFTAAVFSELDFKEKQNAND